MGVRRLCLENWYQEKEFGWDASDGGLKYLDLISFGKNKNLRFQIQKELYPSVDILISLCHAALPHQVKPGSSELSDHATNAANKLSFPLSDVNIWVRGWKLTSATEGEMFYFKGSRFLGLMALKINISKNSMQLNYET